VRRLVAAGGLAIVACTCGLLSSGAASAGPATVDTISVVGVVTGTSAGETTVEFTATGSPFTSISFIGGSNWHFSAVSAAAWSCGLTPTNGGAFCMSQTPATSYTVDGEISGEVPPEVGGEVAFADGKTGTFMAKVTEGAVKCHCAKLSAQFTGFNKKAHNTVYGFFLKWKMNCTTGNAGGCVGQIKFAHAPKLAPGLALRVNKRTWKQHRGLTLTCGPKPANTCPSTVTGRLLFELVGLSQIRANKEITFHAILSCGSKKSEQAFTLTFDENGSLDLEKSQLGKLS
jgi:hypothetical protein